MSLFGKILAFLNLLGVLGLGALAAMDYGKRKAWAYSVFRHELAARGLPLDDTETDAEGRRVVDKLGDKTLADLFAQAGGNPVRTQVAEVERVKGQLSSKVASAGDNVAQILALSRVLAPLADSPRERERYLAYRTHLSDPQALANFKGRVQAAFREAAQPGAADAPAPFEKTFREALRRQAAAQAVKKGQGGEPAEALVLAFLRTLPEDDAKPGAANFDDTWNKALESQRADLEQRFHGAFTEALEGKRPYTGSQEVSTRDQRRLAVARLLFALLPTLAEDALAAGSDEDRKVKGAGDYATRLTHLTGTGAYRAAFARFRVVVGLEMAARAAREHGAAARDLLPELASARANDKTNFVAALQRQIDALVRRADDLDAQEALRARMQMELQSWKSQAARSKEEIEWYEDKIRKEAEEATAARVKTLKELTEALFKLRVQLRDAQAELVDGEKQVRELEAKVQELEKKTKP